MATTHSRRPPSRKRSSWISILSIAAVLSSICLPIAEAAKAASDYYIHNLPGAPASPRLDMYAGHLEITPEHHGNLFFWLVKNRHVGDKKRLVLWLNGGPGCSSMDGAMMEIGPYRVNKDGTLRLQDGSWDEFANVLFVDQPVGTGFSYVDTDSYIEEMDQMASQMMKFLDGFFAIFPDHEHDDIYVAGESYAGQWIPYVAKAILERNKSNQANPWNVAGLLIGNGWISGPEQYISYIPFAYETGVLTAGSDADKKALKQQKKCVEVLDKGGKDRVDTPECEAIMQEILRLTQTSGDKSCINMYDVRLRDSYPSCGMSWPPDLEYVTPYLRREDVIHALHINEDKKSGWVECNNQVSAHFHPKKSGPSQRLLPELLEHMPIILFSGDQDMICNHIGTENVINNLVFNGGTGMETTPGMTAPRRDWTFEGEPAGQYQTARNLTYIRFYNSSHMVPFDFPRRTRDMLDRFMGVNIASIGGSPVDSKIDGEKGTKVSVGEQNSTTSAEEDAARLQEAEWKAYRRSGEAALAVVVIAAIAWGFFVLRDRRRRRGYRGVVGSDPYDDGAGGGLGLNGRKVERDVEAARAYDEAELDDMEVGTVGKSRGRRDLDRDAFALDESEDEDDDAHHRQSNGHAS